MSEFAIANIEPEPETFEEVAHHVSEPFSCVNFRLAMAHEEMNSRRRNTMEDVHRILPALDEKLPKHSYLGIYDGHGGRQIVDYLENALENQLATEILLEDGASMEEIITRLEVIMDIFKSSSKFVKLCFTFMLELS